MARKRETIQLINALRQGLALIEDASERKPNKLIEEINVEAISIIRRFYQSGNPSQGSLYHAFKVSRVDLIDVAVEYGPEFMDEYVHHQDNNIIYNNVFVMGYHGGSWGKGLDDDIPWWRTPTPYYTHWYKRANRSFSPYEEIQKMVDGKIKKYDKEWESFLTRISNNIERSVRGYLRKG